MKKKKKPENKTLRNYNNLSLLEKKTKKQNFQILSKIAIKCNGVFVLFSDRVHCVTPVALELCV